MMNIDESYHGLAKPGTVDAFDKRLYRTVGEATQVVSPITRVHEVLGEARILALQVQSLADRLVGPVPSAGVDPDTSASASEFDNLGANARDTAGFIEAAKDAVLRIQRALP